MSDVGAAQVAADVVDRLGLTRRVPWRIGRFSHALSVSWAGTAFRDLARYDEALALVECQGERLGRGRALYQGFQLLANQLLPWLNHDGIEADMTALSELAALPRIGSLLDASAGSDGSLSLIGAVAARVDSSRWDNPVSVPEAAAWLLAIGHLNALGGPVPGFATTQNFPYPSNSLLCFRGQRARYESIVPSKFRKSEAEQRLHDTASIWLHGALSAWHSAHFYPYGSREAGPWGIETEAAIGVGQHYGLGTILVDWTWDPLIALAFAIENLAPGDVGAIYLRCASPPEQPTRDYSVLLPPTFASRVWRQRGLFAWHPVDPKHFQNRTVLQIDPYVALSANPATYLRILCRPTAEEVEWARERTQDLYREELPILGATVAWSIYAAERGSPKWYGRASYAARESVENECERLGLQTPPWLRDLCEYREGCADVHSAMDYFELMALRRHPKTGELAYHIPALLTGAVGLPSNSVLIAGGPEVIGCDWRAAVFENYAVDRLHDQLRFLTAVMRDYPETASAFYVPRAAPR